MTVEPLLADSAAKLRAFESSLKFFRTWERVREANISETFRDQLLRMEKVGFISDVGMWISLRDLRSRVVHDYLPDALADLYAAIIDEALPELRRLEDGVVRRTHGSSGRCRSPPARSRHLGSLP